MIEQYCSALGEQQQDLSTEGALTRSDKVLFKLDTSKEKLGLRWAAKWFAVWRHYRQAKEMLTAHHMSDFQLD